MQAIQVHEFGDPSVMRLEEATVPAIQPGQILVRVHAAGVNPLEMNLRAGKHPMSAGLKLPWTPGFDAAGEVLELGPGVEGFRVGQRVYGAAVSGSYAEQTLLDVNRTAPLPDSMSWEQGGSLPVVLYTAYYGLIHRGGLRVGESVLVQAGAGGVGQMGIQIAKAAGARVITTVSSAAKADFARSLGADVVINYREEDFVDRCLQETGGRGVDLVLEMVATENFDKDCAALRLGGRLVVLGAGTGKNIVGSVVYPPFYSKNIDVLGFSLMNAGPVYPAMLRECGLLLETGAVRAHVGQSLPLAEAPKAHDLLLSGSVFGKIVLTP